MDTNTAAGAKEAGNAAYKAGRYEVAVALYSKAIELCDDESQRKVCVRVRSCMNVCMSGAYISAAQGFMDACMYACTCLPVRMYVCSEREGESTYA